MSSQKPTLSQKNVPGEVAETVAQRFARAVTRWTGSTPAFGIAIAMVLAWAVTGPIFHYSDTWQLVMNTASSVVTFLMVFLIQRTQNKDSLAMHVKLNEIIQAIEGASNRIVNVEDLSESELEQLQARYQRIAERANRAAERKRLAAVEEQKAAAERP
jgi:low affinity Fe/Cu permease